MTACALAVSATVSFIPSAYADAVYGDCFADNGDPYTATDASGNIQANIPVPPCVPVGSLPVNTATNVSVTVDPVTAAVDLAQQPAPTVPDPGSLTTQAVLDHNFCDDDYRYRITKRYADSFTTAWSETDFNNNANSASFTWNESSSQTVSASFSASFSVDEGIIFASVKETYGITVSASKTTTYGSSATVSNVPRGHSATGKYGVFRVATDGHYIHTDRNCNVTDLGNVRAYSPYYIGWVTYES